jgi:hypothetical protein
VEFLDIIGPLTDPADAFHVVAPSRTGFGFSQLHEPREIIMSRNRGDVDASSSRRPP